MPLFLPITLIIQRYIENCINEMEIMNEKY